MLYTVRPISDRAPFIGQHVDSRFTVTWSQCLEVLERELDQLHGRDVVIEVDVYERGIRMDGQLRADAKAATPAVRLAFDSTHGPLTYATDRFVRPSWRRGGMADDWQHNLYAIACSLEALRKVDRYGVTKRGEQYTGWKALPPGTAMPASHMTTQAAAELLERIAVGDEGAARERSVALILKDQDVARRCLRHARADAHPDRRDGDRTLWDQVEQAATVLGLS